MDRRDALGFLAAGRRRVRCAELGCATWAEAHLEENMRALAGPLPEAALRRRIAADYAGA